MISDEIAALLRIDGETAECSYLTDEWCINWTRVDSLLSDSAGVLDIYDECLKRKRLIDPILSQTRDLLKEPKEFKVKLIDYSKWTHSSTELGEVFDEFSENPRENALTALLRLTSALEFALGNLFQSIFRHPPPHLLKELLQELSDSNQVLPSNQIFILQLILGTAKGVNIRNLIWHGFLEDPDIAYVTFLFVIVISYGKAFQSRMIFSRVRPAIDLSQISINHQHKEIEKLLDSPTIRANNFASWTKIIELVKAKRPKSAVFLLLTQIESLLRFIYGRVNKTVVTARVDKYYVIMDSIFFEYILNDDFTPLVIGKMTKAQEFQVRRSNTRNRLLENFPSALMHLGFDLFHAAEGPRIRDFISHGEAIVDNENSDFVAQKLLHFAALVVRFYDHGEMPELSYESIFMGNMKLAQRFNEACDVLADTFQSLITPPQLVSGDTFSFTFAIKPLKPKLVKNFFRPFAETQIVKLLASILENFVEASKHFTLTCSEFFLLFGERKLSTSRRQSLRHLVKSLPNYHQGLLSLLIVVQGTFDFIQSFDDDKSDNNFSGLVRLLKSSLKFTECLVKSFSPAGRNFFIANEKTCEFLELIDKSKHLYALEDK